MSRPSSTVPARPLTLTEELEKLEQSITLTLQEIDHNFSRAHRIVTGSILPLVEQYGEHSRNVWDATKFWKQFFEASANVSLSGYEELANNEPEESTEIERTVDESTAQYSTPRNQQHHEDVSQLEADQSSVAYQQRHQQDESMFDNSNQDISGSTPRPPIGKAIPSRSQMAALSSPYEKLKREYSQKPGTPGYEPTPKQEEDDNTSLLIQEHTARLPDMSMHPRHRHSPEHSQHTATQFLASEDDDDLAFLKLGNKKNTDPVLHHLKDKNFRVMATPHKSHTGVSPLKWKITSNPAPSNLFTTPGKGKDATLTTRPIWADSPGDSPEIALPQLRSAAFMSPTRAAYRSAALKHSMNAPRTPGVSVQTPAAKGGKTKDVYGNREDKYMNATGDELGWSEDDDEDERELSEIGGMSPPKTIQFALPPGRLLQTPAREASRRIVEGLLMRAGGTEDDMTLDFTGVVPGFGQPQQQQQQGGSGSGQGQRGYEYSPTLVKMSMEMQDDTF
ncbi:putative DASH complex subunit [Triangularia verruculosa]|uniref:DASH complex subunit ASK1 n=1 Tax=Triangularia verruculosa TaxID=2587418 RepID=A0AAN7AYZ1_9PEZI|nr:putative DASH complex subunit [Triangularia verruculosa]